MLTCGAGSAWSGVGRLGRDRVIERLRRAQSRSRRCRFFSGGGWLSTQVKPMLTPGRIFQMRPVPLSVPSRVPSSRSAPPLTRSRRWTSADSSSLLVDTMRAFRDHLRIPLRYGWGLSAYAVVVDLATNGGISQRLRVPIWTVPPLYLMGAVVVGVILYLIDRHKVRHYLAIAALLSFGLWPLLILVHLALGYDRTWLNRLAAAGLIACIMGSAYAWVLWEKVKYDSELDRSE
jgi:hypothetical protein